jgi:hypothetical protein
MRTHYRHPQHFGGRCRLGVRVQRPLSAADVVNSLQAEDYSVQLNATADVPLSKRTVSGIHCLLSSRRCCC